MFSAAQCAQPQPPSAAAACTSGVGRRAGGAAAPLGGHAPLRGRPASPSLRAAAAPLHVCLCTSRSSSGCCADVVLSSQGRPCHMPSDQCAGPFLAYDSIRPDRSASSKNECCSITSAHAHSRRTLQGKGTCQWPARCLVAPGATKHCSCCSQLLQVIIPAAL